MIPNPPERTPDPMRNLDRNRFITKIDPEVERRINTLNEQLDQVSQAVVDLPTTTTPVTSDPFIPDLASVNAAIAQLRYDVDVLRAEFDNLSASVEAALQAIEAELNRLGGLLGGASEIVPSAELVESRLITPWYGLNPDVAPVAVALHSDFAHWEADFLTDTTWNGSARGFAGPAYLPAGTYHAIVIQVSHVSSLNGDDITSPALHVGVYLRDVVTGGATQKIVGGSLLVSQKKLFQKLMWTDGDSLFVPAVRPIAVPLDDPLIWPGGWIIQAVGISGVGKSYADGYDPYVDLDTSYSFATIGISGFGPTTDYENADMTLSSWVFVTSPALPHNPNPPLGDETPSQIQLRKTQSSIGLSPSIMGDQPSWAPDSWLPTIPSDLTDKLYPFRALPRCWYWTGETIPTAFSLGTGSEIPPNKPASVAAPIGEGRSD